ncbi:hypothetical protein TPA0906_29470 [Streptomyces olivaceus]|nr:hypothetical protein TPA0906_29470 [Streptomyces olivaceus]
MADEGEGSRSRRVRRQPFDVFRDAPESRTVWERLLGPVLEAVARCDAGSVGSRAVEEEGGQALSQLLECLDARFHAATAPDPNLSLRPWIRPTKDRPEEELGEWWKRKPVRVPWAD